MLSCPTSAGARCSISARGTATTRSSPSGEAHPAWSRSITTPGASTSPRVRSTGTTASPRRASRPVARHDRLLAPGPSRPARLRPGAPRAREPRGDVVADFTSVDLSTLGTFDIVLYLGVLYHMKEPLTCFERLHAVTRDVAVIETVAAQVPCNAGRSLLELHAGGELNSDFGNWYVPTIEALGALARARRASPASTCCAARPHSRLRGRVARRLRLVPKSRPNPAAANFRAVIHAHRRPEAA